LSLQVNLLAEQEATQMLKMLRSICDRLGLQKDDKELAEMIRTTHVEVLAQELGKAREEAEAEAAAEAEARPAKAGE
jgi:uncharacterized membrane protein